VLLATNTQDDEIDPQDVDAFLHALDGQLRALIAP